MDQVRRRVLTFGLLLGLGVLTGAGRLGQLSLESPESARAASQRMSTRMRSLPARRGTLFDRNGRVMAASVDALRVEVVPRNLHGRRSSPGDRARLVSDVATLLSPWVGQSEDELRVRLAGDRHVRLGEPVTDPDGIDLLLGQSGQLLYGLDLLPDSIRRQPWGQVAGNLVGFVDHQNRGVAGLEQGLGSVLAGSDGACQIRVSPLGKEVFDPSLPRVEAIHGQDVTLTIDLRAQQIIEEELLVALTKQDARRAFAVLLDTATGDILAMASVPSLDPQQRTEGWQNGAVMAAMQEVYAPGSTFKPLMMTAALDLGLVRTSDSIDCRRERGVIKSRRIRDTHPVDGSLTPEEIIIESSNIGIASILMGIVPEATPKDTAAMAPVHAFLGRLGFGQLTGVPLPAESGGIVTPLSRWVRHWTLASVSFGQEISVTALQMAAAVSALADGQIRTPRLVAGSTDGNGIYHEQPASDPRPAFSRSHADLVRGWMVSAVQEGGCQEVRIPGVAVAGKTGTADSEVDLSREIHSYTALVPAEAPILTLVVVVSEPKKARYASESAGPAAGLILRRLLPYFGHPLE